MSSDDELMGAVARGDVQALASLFERHHQSVFGFCHRLLADHTAAEDAVQDVFLRIYDRRGTFRREARFLPWMYAIARNLCLDRMKAMERSVLKLNDLEQEVADPRQESPAHAAERRELAAAVRDAVTTLPEDQRLVVLLHEYQGLDYPAIAVALRCSVPAVRVRLHRARQALRKRLSSFVTLNGEIT